MKEMVLTAEAEGLIIHYFRTQGHLKDDDDDKRIPIYGIAATKYIDGKEEEQADAGFISTDADYVGQLIAMLGKHTVTPLALCEVLDELLSA